MLSGILRNPRIILGFSKSVPGLIILTPLENVCWSLEEGDAGLIILWFSKSNPTTLSFAPKLLLTGCAGISHLTFEELEMKQDLLPEQESPNS